MNASNELDIGSVAQWLGRWSLAGGLSMTCARSTVDRWVNSTMGQPTRPTQPSIPHESVNE